MERLNTRKPNRFVSSQLLQLRYYDPDGKRCESIADQALELWLVMPSATFGGPVQEVEHAGGPVRQKDPDIPDLERYVVTCWVTVANSQYA